MEMMDPVGYFSMSPTNKMYPLGILNSERTRAELSREISVN